MSEESEHKTKEEEEDCQPDKKADDGRNGRLCEGTGRIWKENNGILLWAWEDWKDFASFKYNLGLLKAPENDLEGNNGILLLVWEDWKYFASLKCNLGLLKEPEEWSEVKQCGITDAWKDWIAI